MDLVERYEGEENITYIKTFDVHVVSNMLHILSGIKVKRRYEIFMTSLIAVKYLLWKLEQFLLFTFGNHMNRIIPNKFNYSNYKV